MVVSIIKYGYWSSWGVNTRIEEIKIENVMFWFWWDLSKDYYKGLEGKQIAYSKSVLVNVHETIQIYFVLSIGKQFVICKC